MNKPQLIDLIAKKGNISKVEAKRALELTINSITETLSKGVWGEGKNNVRGILNTFGVGKPFSKSIQLYNYPHNPNGGEGKPTSTYPNMNNGKIKYK